ncbi:MAG: cobalt-precorrin-5B (C(1))-methyltransferase CbiD [Synechococcus sp.]
MARSGFTLPVFAVAAAKAALLLLMEQDEPQRAKNTQTVELDIMPDRVDAEPVVINIEQVAVLAELSSEGGQALAIARSDPGDNLDLTRNTPIWAYVRLIPREDSVLVLEAGEGLGQSADGEPAIYRYAKQLFAVNVEPVVPERWTAIVRIILPEGRQLAQRTSNEAFGVLEGLALLGTSGISKPLAATDALRSFRSQLQERAASSQDLVFCIGSNGQRVATGLGIPDGRVIPTANWVGAMLVEAALLDVRSVLLIGYHGKLLKLAGGIFHTSSHIADAKLEILAAEALRVGCNRTLVRSLLDAATADDARLLLAQAGWSDRVFEKLSQRIEDKATSYVQKYSDRPLDIGVILFDRTGELVVQTDRASRLLAAMA